MQPTDTPRNAQFEAELRAEGFVEIQTREIAGGTHNAAHAHPFEVKAMMLAGELQLGCGGETTTYRAGEVFTMAAGREHVEQFGSETARYVVGRKHPA